MTFEPGVEKDYDEVKAEVDEAIETHAVVLFMKGTALMPQCGYSRTALNLIGRYRDAVEVVNVLEGPTDHYRNALNEHSGWETIPQAFVDGEFIGGADILKQLDERGELAEALGSEPADAPF